MTDSKKAHYVVTTAIIQKNKKFLIVKRADWEHAFPGLWTVPGGKMETTDYTFRPHDHGTLWYNVCEDLVKREVKEEVNLSISNLRYLTSIAFIRPDSIPTIIISMLADYKSGDVKLCHALTEYQWVSKEEAKEFALIDGIQYEINVASKILKNQTTTNSTNTKIA